MLIFNIKIYKKLEEEISDLEGEIANDKEHIVHLQHDLTKAQNSLNSAYELIDNLYAELISIRELVNTLLDTKKCYKESRNLLSKKIREIESKLLRAKGEPDNFYLDRLFSNYTVNRRNH